MSKKFDKKTTHTTYGAMLSSLKFSHFHGKELNEKTLEDIRNYIVGDFALSMIKGFDPRSIDSIEYRTICNTYYQVRNNRVELIIMTEESDEAYDNRVSEIKNKAKDKELKPKTPKITIEPKTLVYSIPDEDDHYSYAVKKKSVDHINRIFGTYQYGTDFDITTCTDNFLEKLIKVNKLDCDLDTLVTYIEGMYDTQEDVVRDYFEIQIKKKSYTLSEFSSDLIEIIPNHAGSMSSFVWV